jgi:transcriptional regulator GlxA family with amidase domain
LQRLNDARDIVAGCYVEELTVSILVRRVGLDRKKLTEGFRELLGKTVQGFLVEQRMYAALDLVKKDLPVEQITEQVG